MKKVYLVYGFDDGLLGVYGSLKRANSAALQYASTYGDEVTIDDSREWDIYYELANRSITAARIDVQVMK